jgi:hypothetical protein
LFDIVSFAGMSNRECQYRSSGSSTASSVSKWMSRNPDTVANGLGAVITSAINLSNGQSPESVFLNAFQPQPQPRVCYGCCGRGGGMNPYYGFMVCGMCGGSGLMY